mmetsp:Transcript_16481/g.28557  ORF Transcript_16481/g.28557 Transcript_16481/m.28557 type:complete len:352 (+) Transcript_16481:524-1579(+)
MGCASVLRHTRVQQSINIHIVTQKAKITGSPGKTLHPTPHNWSEQMHQNLVLLSEPASARLSWLPQLLSASLFLVSLTSTYCCPLDPCSDGYCNNRVGWRCLYSLNNIHESGQITERQCLVQRLRHVVDDTGIKIIGRQAGRRALGDRNVDFGIGCDTAMVLQYALSNGGELKFGRDIVIVGGGERSREDVVGGARHTPGKDERPASPPRDRGNQGGSVRVRIPWVWDKRSSREALTEQRRVVALAAVEAHVLSGADLEVEQLYLEPGAEAGDVVPQIRRVSGPRVNEIGIGASWTCPGQYLNAGSAGCATDSEPTEPWGGHIVAVEARANLDLHLNARARRSDEVAVVFG